jgi:hypothetical protein
MLAELSPVTVEGVDPYYARPKRWRAISLETLVTRGLRRDLDSLRREDFVLRAADGYATQVSGAALLEGGAHVAYRRRGWLVGRQLFHRQSHCAS